MQGTSLLSHRQHKMNSTKRSREGSPTVRPTLSDSHYRRTSLLSHLSPVCHSQHIRYELDQPSKRNRLHHANGRLSSEASSTQSSSASRISYLRHQAQANADLDPEDDADVAIREENDSLDEVIMAVDLKERGSVGCCYYVAREEKVCLRSSSAISSSHMHRSSLSSKMSDLEVSKSLKCVSNTQIIPKAHMD